MGGRFFNDLHHDEVLVDLRRGRAEERRELVLVRRDLAVARAERDAEAEALGLDLLHARERGRRVRRGRHVVVAHLLAARRVGAHDRAAREHQILALRVLVARDEEDLLLEADVRPEARGLVAQELEEAHALAVERVDRAEERRLLVERVAEEGDEARRDEDRVAPQVDRRRRVDLDVAARAVRAAEAARRVRRAVRLALDEVLALEVPDGNTIIIELEEGVLDHAHEAVAHARGALRLERVRERRRVVLGGPLEDRGRDLVGHGRVLGPLRVAEGGGGEALLREVGLGGGALEDVVAVALEEARDGARVGAERRLRRRLERLS